MRPPKLADAGGQIRSVTPGMFELPRARLSFLGAAARGVEGLSAPLRWLPLALGVATLEREVERLHGTVDRASKQRVILHRNPRLLWAEGDFRQRRQLLRLIVERVDVMPARRGARFDPCRVRLEIPLLPASAES